MTTMQYLHRMAGFSSCHLNALWGARLRSTRAATRTLMSTDSTSIHSLNANLPTLISIVMVMVFAAFASPASAGAKVKNPSPDGRFAMSLEDGQDGEVRITLVETKSHKFVLKLSDSGHPFSDACRILWSPDSKRFAFSEEDRKRNWTSVYIRKDSGFEMTELPDLPECDHPGLSGFIQSNQTPKSWTKSDTLVLTAHDEWTTEDDKAHECDRTVTVAIDATGKASIQSVREDKKK
jgi:hypothetical protein